MKTFIFISFCVALFSLSSCNRINRPVDFVPQDLSNVTQVELADTAGMKTIVVAEPEKEQIPASALIEEVRYLPLETSDESLFTYCTDLLFYKDRIYLMDRLGAEAVFIYDMQGKLLKRLGDKGGAPFEFALLKGMAIDKEKDRLLLYDNRKRKIVYFTLTGDYLKTENVNFRFKGQFDVLPSGNLIYVTNKGDYNFHLNEFSDYRLLYTDTAGLITKGAYKWMESECADIAYTSLLHVGDELLYYPFYMNEICTVTDTTLRVRYNFDYSGFNPFEKEKLGSITNERDFEKYSYYSTYLDSYAENTTHLFFVTHHENKGFMTFYDKRTDHQVSCRTVLYDTDFAIEFSPMYSFGDYFVATVQPGTLRGFRDVVKNKTKYPLTEEVSQLLDNVKEDDNPALVFFKIKKL